jgi:hypothetical protein
MTGSAGGAVHREKVLLAERIIITQVIASSDPGTPVSLFELTSDYARNCETSRTECGYQLLPAGGSEAGRRVRAAAQSSRVAP